jgi:exodeoxyribonuclease VII small subunit
MAKKTFEAALERLETIVADLEAGDLPLEDAVKAFQEGMELTKFCKGKLADSEARLQQLVKDSDGTFQLTMLE